MASFKKPGQVSLIRALSKLGLASRTRAEKLILDSKIKVNGKLESNPNKLVVPEKIKIEIDGETAEKQERVLLLLNKPKNFITTNNDEKNRPTVFSLIKNIPQNLHAIGRLDAATTGLLLLTNDTRISSWLTDPNNKIPRDYVVVVRGDFTEEKAEVAKRGVPDLGEILKANKIEIKKTSGKESTLVVQLLEGKNREIRRIFEKIGHPVLQLKRIQFGNLELGSLESGKYLEITIETFIKAFPKYPKKYL